MHERSRASVVLVGVCVAFIGVCVFALVRACLSLSGQVSGLQEVGYVAPAEHHVLFLSSYDPNYENYQLQDPQIKSVFEDEGVSYDTFFMYTKQYDTEQAMASFYDDMRERVSDAQYAYDAVLVADDAALRFVVSYRDDLFPDVPVVFFGVNDAELARTSAENPLICGSVESYELEKTIDVARTLQPDARRVVAIVDGTQTGEGTAKEFRALADAYPDLAFREINVSELSRDQIEEALRAVGSDEILLYLDAYRDADGTNYTIAEFGRIINANVRQPVFRQYLPGVGTCATGGYVYDMRGAAREAASTVVAVIRGEASTAELGSYNNVGGSYVFDCASMRRYGLETSQLPEGTTLINDSRAKLGELMPLVAPAAGIGLGLVALLVVLARSAATNRSLALQLKGQNREISSSRRRLVYANEHDALTDVLNRRTADRRLRELFDARRTFSVVLVDIDNFTSINEGYGHKVADEVLARFSGRVKALAEGDPAAVFVARYGGDKFMVVYEGVHLDEDSREILRLEDVCHRSIKVVDADGEQSRVRTFASVGIANSSPGVRPEDLVIDANVALHAAKVRGKNGTVLFADELRARTLTQNHAADLVVTALRHDGFTMVYQPQVDVRTREVVGFEALVRLKGEEVPPGVFVPAAEETGHIRQLGRHTTRLVVRQIAAWIEAGVEVRPVSVNYSSYQVADVGYVDFLLGLLEEYDVSASLVKIEITERVLIGDNSDVKALFSRLTQAGVKLLLDDFGTGYSSLSYLTYMPVSMLKLDKSLIDAYVFRDDQGPDGALDNAFIGDLIKLAHDLDKTICAEGVESEWQAEVLRALGCDCIQGYYFSRPLKPADVPRFRVAPRA